MQLNQTLWQHDLKIENIAIFSNIYIGSKYKELEISGDYLLFGIEPIEANRGFYLFNKFNGEKIYFNEIWNNKFVVKDGILYIAADKLLTFNLSNLKEVWNIDIRSTFCNPYVSDELVYIMSEKKGKNLLFAIEKSNGKIKWEYPVKEIDFRFEYNAKNKTLFYTIEDYLYALNTNNKNIIWSKKCEKIIYDLLLLYDKYLIVDGGTDDTISAIDCNTGKIIWQVFNINNFILASPPTVLNNILYIGGPDYIYAIDVTNGKILWKTEHIERLLYIKIINSKLNMSLDGINKIYQYDLQTGKLLKEIKLNNIITSPFEYEEGVIYYRSENMLYAEKVKL